eukprot:3676907-Amphidinium_carterae.2
MAEQCQWFLATCEVEPSLPGADDAWRSIPRFSLLWTREYEAICARHGWNATEGLDFPQFAEYLAVYSNSELVAAHEALLKAMTESKGRAALFDKDSAVPTTASSECDDQSDDSESDTSCDEDEEPVSTSISQGESTNYYPPDDSVLSTAPP